MWKIIDNGGRTLLSSEILFQQLKTSCNESYVNVDPSNTACVMALAYYEKVRWI
jgi:serine carboxypeptidase-like clade 1